MKDNISLFIIGFIIGLFIACGLWFLNYKHHKPKEVYIPTPVEKERIDTLYITRDSIIYRIKYLDSIKYDTVEKVYKLNDTSTLDLFYKLVSE